MGLWVETIPFPGHISIVRFWSGNSLKKKLNECRGDTDDPGLDDHGGRNDDTSH